MYIDPSWDIMPVANPDLPEGKRRRKVRDSLARDPVGAAKPTYQVRHRHQIVAPFSLDRACRQLLLSAQVAIDSVLGSALQQARLPDIVAEARYADMSGRSRWPCATSRSCGRSTSSIPLTAWVADGCC